MTDKLQVAVILAAGMGERLKEAGKTIPKGFLRLGKRAIIEESIDKLLRAGIKRIIIVTGHHFEFYERLKTLYPGTIETVHNSQFFCSGSMYSLFCAKDRLKEDFLLLESDIVYEERAIAEILQFKQENGVLLSGPTFSGDEVYVAASGTQIVGLSKFPDDIGSHIVGELIGITKVSQSLFKEMITDAEIRFKNTLQVAYETDCLSAVSSKYPLYYHLVPDIVWSEIDTPADLLKTRNSVYPAIIEQAQVKEIYTNQVLKPLLSET